MRRALMRLTVALVWLVWDRTVALVAAGTVGVVMLTAAGKPGNVIFAWSMIVCAAICIDARSER